jgi:hypothetical protein
MMLLGIRPLEMTPRNGTTRYGLTRNGAALDRSTEKERYAYNISSNSYS